MLVLSMEALFNLKLKKKFKNRKTEMPGSFFHVLVFVILNLSIKGWSTPLTKSIHVVWTVMSLLLLDKKYSISFTCQNIFFHQEKEKYYKNDQQNFFFLLASKGFRAHFYHPLHKNGQKKKEKNMNIHYFPKTNDLCADMPAGERPIVFCPAIDVSWGLRVADTYSQAQSKPSVSENIKAAPL